MSNLEQVRTKDGVVNEEETEGERERRIPSQRSTLRPSSSPSPSNWRVLEIFSLDPSYLQSAGTIRASLALTGLNHAKDLPLLGRCRPAIRLSSSYRTLRVPNDRTNLTSSLNRSSRTNETSTSYSHIQYVGRKKTFASPSCTQFIF